MKRALSLLTMITFLTFIPSIIFAAANLEEGTSELASQISKNILSTARNKIAVIEFTNLDGTVTDLGQFLAEELITKLFTLGGGKFEVIERSQLRKVFAELGFQMTGAVDENTVKKIGKVLGVDAIVTGSVTDLENTVKINARMISTETAKVFAVAATEIPKVGTVMKLMDRKLAQKDPVRREKTRLEENDLTIQCWGDDLTDGVIGGWKSRYPHCILDDGGGDSNAIFDGELALHPNQVCVTMKNLSTQSPPAHTLAVGFQINLKRGTFSDGSASKTVEMRRFVGNPIRDSVQKCFEVQ